MKVHFTTEEINEANNVCLECEDHICNWKAINVIYCLKHKTDSLVFLVDKCDKLNELK